MRVTVVKSMSKEVYVSNLFKSLFSCSHGKICHFHKNMLQVTSEASLFSAAVAFWTLPTFPLVTTEVLEIWEQPQSPLPLPRFNPTPATTGEND